MTAIAANTVSFPATKTSRSDRSASVRLQAPTLPDFLGEGRIDATIGRTVLALIPFSALAFIFIAV